MSFLFGSKAQRTFKKIQDLASGDMVDQAAVMVEEELDTLLEDHDIAGKLVPFLMDIGHPDLGGRIGEKIIRSHSDLRMTVTRLLEEKQAQFPRSIELLRVIWKARLHQRDFSGLMDILGRTERVTVNRFAESIQSSWQTLGGAAGRELGAGIDRILAWAMITLHKGDPGAAMDILVDAAERCRFPEESLARLSGWIAARTGGADMSVNLKRIRILTAIGDRERAIAELPGLYDAESDILTQAVSLVEKELVPHDKTRKAKISLARLMGKAGRVNEACLVLDPLIEKDKDSSLLEQAVTGIVLNASGAARAHLLQARLRLSRGENTQALDSVERAFNCKDVAESPVVDICRSFIDSGIDRDGLVTGRLGEFLVEQGSVEEAVKILILSVHSSPEWVLEKLQQLLKRDRTSSAVLTLLAVVLLVLGRGGEAAATLKHLTARKDVKSKQDIVSVLSEFDDLMTEHTELRRLRAASGAGNGHSKDSAADWLELLLSGEKISDEGYLTIFDKGLHEERSAELLDSSFKPSTPAGELLYAAAMIRAGHPENSSSHLTTALGADDLLERVTSLVASLPFSTVSAMKPDKLFKALNTCGRGSVVAKLLPLMASCGTEEWMNDLASEIVLESNTETVFFRMRYFIDIDKPGTGAASVAGLEADDEDITNLVTGCRAIVSGDMDRATEHLSLATASTRTASLAKTVLSSIFQKDKGSTSSAIAIAMADVKTGNADEAAETLKPVLDQRDVLDYLEKAVMEVPGAHALHGALALARLFAGNPVGYRESAGTAAEGNSGMLEELVQQGIKYSMENDYAHGLLFAAELGIENISGFDPSDLLVRALCLDPSLHGRIDSLKIEDPSLGTLLALASQRSQEFVAGVLPDHITVPLSMISDARKVWGEQKAVKALSALEEIAGVSGYGDEAHELRKILAVLQEDRSEGLLNDALSKEEWLPDFLALCSSREIAESSIDRLFPDGLQGAHESRLEAIVNMLIRCGSREKLFQVTMELLKSGSRECRKAAGIVVDVYMPTAGEEGSLSVDQIVELLLISDRFADAFSMARGDSGLLAKVRARLSREDAQSDSIESCLRSGRTLEAVSKGRIQEDPMNTGEALWRSGQRTAACGVWRKAYEVSADPAFLVRLNYALECMGYGREAAAVKRLLSDKHPDHLCRTGIALCSKNTLAMISYT